MLPLPSPPIHTNRSWLRSLTMGCFLAATLVGGLGCPKKVQLGPAIPGDLPDPHASYVLHNYGLNWTGDDLVKLQSLRIENAAEIEIIPSRSRNLTVSLELKTETQGHESLSESYLDQIALQSQLAGDAVTIRIPQLHQLDPVLRCRSTETNGRSLTQGVCPGKLVIATPAELPKNLHLIQPQRLLAEEASFQNLALELAPTTRALLRENFGDLSLSGGSPQAALQLIGLHAHSARQTFGDASGKFSANVEGVSNLDLTRIDGAVTIDLRQRDSGLVRLDNQIIRTFPFNRK